MFERVGVGIRAPDGAGTGVAIGSERAGGPRYLASARRSVLVRMIDQRGHIAVSEMATELNVSEMTIRRDLDHLAGAGLVSRDHGGATAIAPKSGVDRDEPAFELRGRRQADAKATIARAAARLVKPGQTIGLDTGSTTHRFAEELLPVAGLRIFSSNLRTAGMLAAGASPVYLLGGHVRPRELSVCGPVASAQLRALWLDTVFIGIAGLTEQGGSDYSLEDGEIKRVYIERASQVVVLCDSSKLDRRALVLVAQLGEIDTLVIEARPTGLLADALGRAEVRVVVAGETDGAQGDRRGL
jgi:DeoR family glycerol-3-phosphate regulon repressor